MSRRISKKIKVGNIYIGGDAPISVQSMTNRPAHDFDGTLEQVKRLADAGVRSVSLSCYDALLAAAVEEGVIAREDVPRLERFRRNPQDEGWMAL